MAFPSTFQFSDCKVYVEDPYICDDVGEPKGQCLTCGAKWYEHNLDVLSGDDKESAKDIQIRFGLPVIQFPIIDPYTDEK